MWGTVGSLDYLNFRLKCCGRSLERPVSVNQPWTFIALLECASIVWESMCTGCVVNEGRPVNEKGKRPVMTSKELFEEFLADHERAGTTDVESQLLICNGR